ncbi:MAG: exodeoxyribonuclease VII large subunit [Planctomycetes bacterium]|nr:exodeoxyribonuclease VII large subunit [Planctomycetota bacterium]
MAKKKAKIYSVKEINTQIKYALEDGLPARMVVKGEVSGWRPHASGHSYFSLKDEGGVLPCVMWKGKVGKVKFKVDAGMAVLATGHIDVYVPGGKYQFSVDKLEPAGVGDLQLAFEKMVKKLRAEGLFADEHKKPVPAYPMRIGIVTSASGAAVKDIADSVYSRWPCAKLLIYPASVQGAGSADQIAKAMRAMNRRNQELNIDVLIVGRGGGSMEDLWAFNEEPVARAIFASKIPVISAVGHEIDFTIADYVADARASTPTKAGVIAVPDMVEVLERISAAEGRLRQNCERKVEVCMYRLEAVEGHSCFRDPILVVNNATQQVDETAMRLSDCIGKLLASLREKLAVGREQVLRIEPHRLLGEKKLEANALVNAVAAAMKNLVVSKKPAVERLENRVISTVERIITKKKLQLTAIENRLAGLNPRSVLDRGYSITTLMDSDIVVSAAKQVKPGDVLVTELAGNERINSRVIDSN